MSKRKHPTEQSFRLEGHYGKGVDSGYLLVSFSYYNYEEYEDYTDVEYPRNYGRRSVNTEEWDDYILEAQLLWVEHLDTLEIDHKRYNKEYDDKRKGRIKV